MEASGIDINEYYSFMISLGFLPYNEIDNLLMVRAAIQQSTITYKKHSLTHHPNSILA